MNPEDVAETFQQIAESFVRATRIEDYAITAEQNMAPSGELGDFASRLTAHIARVGTGKTIMIQEEDHHDWFQEGF